MSLIEKLCLKLKTVGAKVFTVIFLRQLVERTTFKVHSIMNPDYAMSVIIFKQEKIGPRIPFYPYFLKALTIFFNVFIRLRQDNPK